MKNTLSIVTILALSLKSAMGTNTWYDWTGAAWPGSGFFNFYYGWSVPVSYYSDYKSGAGPYYTSSVLPLFNYPLGDNMHYEEYGAIFDSTP